MTWVKLISPEKMTMICTLKLNEFYDAPEGSGDYITTSGKTVSAEIVLQAGGFIEIDDINSNNPTTTDGTRTFVRAELIEREVFKDEYPELFL